MTQRARPLNYNHLKKEWVIIRTETDTASGQPETSTITKPLTHNQAIKMVIYLQRNRTRNDLEIQRVLA